MPNATSFPRPVFDKDGVYAINEAGAYEVESPLVARYHEVVFAGRDLATAHEMVEQCCREDLDDIHPLLEQSLWIGAVILYGKPFKKNNARGLFDAPAILRSRAGPEMRDLHHYLINLRDKMVAHDDGLGECKKVVVGFPARSPVHISDIGIEPVNPRVVSLGWDIAREVEPHFQAVCRLFVEYREEVRNEVLKELLRSDFQSVTLLGRAQPADLKVDIDSVNRLWPRQQ